MIDIFVCHLSFFKAIEENLVQNEEHITRNGNSLHIYKTNLCC